MERKVNSISKGRAAKAKRETKTTLPMRRTASGALQFDKGPESVTESMKLTDSPYFAPAWSAAMDRKFPGKGYDKLEIKDRARAEKFQQELSDLRSGLKEASHKLRTARNKSSFKGSF